ncbi:MAG: aminotransferase class V-fold PLP-dependent enzyme [Oscillospiraceae bacterium]
MIYLDCAATTFQKPPAVAGPMERAMATMSSPGRGGYQAAMEAAQHGLYLPDQLAEMFHVENPERGIYYECNSRVEYRHQKPGAAGGRAVISGYEHNAVTRPLAALRAKTAVAAAPLFQPEAVLAALQQTVTPDTDAVICNHASNVFGFIQPVEEIAALCRSRGVPLVVDASNPLSGSAPAGYGGTGCVLLLGEGRNTRDFMALRGLVCFCVGEGDWSDR